MTRVIRERVEQRQQQRDRQNRHQKFRRHRECILEDIEQMQFAFLHILQFGEQIVKAIQKIENRRGNTPAA